MRLTAQTLETPTVEISIHAPLTGCDLMPTYNLPVRCDFNPRTPYGMRPFISFLVFILRVFQSTHPLRDATFHVFIYDLRHVNFNPRTPYGMRQSTSFYQSQVLIISIHAPLTGCDFNKNGSNGQYGDFNPRTPYGMRL